MQSNMSANFSGMVVLFNIRNDLSHEATHVYDAGLFVDGNANIFNVEDREGFASTLEFYVPRNKDPPTEGVMAFCSGTFKATTINGTTSICLRPYIHTVFPGDPDAEDYDLGCPTSIPLQLSIIGLTIATPKTQSAANSVRKSFTVALSVYDRVEKSVPMEVLCVFPTTGRWDKYYPPGPKALVSVSGDFAGIDKTSRSIVILIRSYERISAMTSEAATPSSSPVKQHASPSAKRVKWGTFSGSQSTASKRVESPDSFVSISSDEPKPTQISTRSSTKPRGKRTKDGQHDKLKDLANKSLNQMLTSSKTKGKDVQVARSDSSELSDAPDTD